MSSPSPTVVPALPPMQIGPDSSSNIDQIEFDASVNNPFDKKARRARGRRYSIAVAKPGYNERARKSKYTKKGAANTSTHASKPKKHQISQGKRLYVERKAEKYLICCL